MFYRIFSAAGFQIQCSDWQLSAKQWLFVVKNIPNNARSNHMLAKSALQVTQCGLAFDFASAGDQ